MTTKQPPKAKKGELDRTEWCFTSIPKHETEACCFYEYARELARQKHRLVDSRVKSKAGCSEPKRKPEKYERPRECLRDKSWHELHEKVRSKLAKDQAILSYVDSLNIKTLTQLKAAHITSIRKFRALQEWLHKRYYVHELVNKNYQEYLNGTEYGLFAINWNYSDPATAS